jgi:Family of unknown function (DUF5906)
MDFYQLKERPLEGKKLSIVEVYPDFKIVRSKDLMVRGRGFYAIWDEEKNLWSTDEYDVQRLVDADIAAWEVRTEMVSEIHRKFLGNFSSNTWLQFRNYVGHLSDNSHQLDEELIFANTDVKKEDYVSRRLSYPLQEGDISSYNELIGTLYSPDERSKLEWAVGAIIAGDAKQIQKFIVLYGAAGTGKSTFLLLLQKLTQGYFVTFDAKALTGNNNAFATSAFKDNPLVAIQHDGDLSRIEDNTKLNSIVSHETMQVNEKNKPMYDMTFNAFLFVGTNKPVKISDAKSGLLRRLIDVKPTGNRLSPRKYQTLMTQAEFELGAIAAHCLNVYRDMGKDYYSGYRPEDMMMQTDIFFNFIEWHWDDLKREEGISLAWAYDIYKEYCKDSSLDFTMAKYKFREELKNYFETYEDVHVHEDGTKDRGYYTDFTANKFKSQKHVEEDSRVFSLVMDETESLFDREMATMPAQYAPANGEDYMKFWTNKTRIGKNSREYIPAESRVVKTTLQDLDTSKEHYVKVPENHIVIDFDLKDADGQKSAERNLEAASSWPSTYAEFSKSGAGIHLHYIYDGDTSELSSVYDDGIEVKLFRGDASLRRMLSRCNNVPVATISSGLPLKEKKVMNSDQIKSEKALRELIERNLRKEIHPGTKSSVDFIHQILEEAYASDLVYDVTDMRNMILAFANGSTNQPLQAIKMVTTMKFASEVTVEKYEDIKEESADVPLVFFDVEVFKNLFMICWKYADSETITTMINPTPKEVEELMKFRLIGFYNRRYDNHIIYARVLGFDNERLYKLSQRLISGTPNSMFGEAYNVSYADVWDFANEKKSLKKWEVDLDIPHKELSLPWDEPVDESLWPEVSKYCMNDVSATEAVFKERQGDFVARQILSELTGLPVNATTQMHTAKLVFGDNRRPQEDFVYTRLEKIFPGYVYELGKSSYKGENPGEGGYNWGVPGVYENVVLLDAASMHPTSIEQLDLFGPYTKNFSELKKARIAIKHKNFDEAKEMFGGRLAKYLENVEGAEALAYALKTVINIVYGLTSARFDNSFRDPRNVDNIVAKRGALFMINLKEKILNLGYQIIHIKTDSVKIVVPKGENPKKIIDIVMEYGLEYGYEFEHEATYEKIALVNDSVFVAYVAAGREPAHWTATGAQFQHPYVFKKLFTHENIQFRDKCEVKSVTTSLWLDFTSDKEAMALANDNKRFVGRTGVFCPMVPEHGGGILQREKDGKFFAATGSTGYEWLESEMVKTLGLEKEIDMTYFDKLVDTARTDIGQYCDIEWFLS